MEVAPGEEAVEMIEATAKDLASCTNGADKAGPALGMIGSNLERSSAVDKMLSDSITCYREVVHGRRSRLQGQT